MRKHEALHFILTGAVLIKPQSRKETAASEEMLQENDNKEKINNVDRNDPNSSNPAFSSIHPETDNDTNQHNIVHNNTPDDPPSTQYSRVHMGNDSDIEAAAQDAVLREQVCFSFKIVLIFMFCFVFWDLYDYFFFLYITGNGYPNNHTEPKVCICFLSSNFSLFVGSIYKL